MKYIIIALCILFISNFSFSQTNTNKDLDKTSKPTSIVFKNTVYDFGTVEYGEEAIGEFVFKNISKSPIRLTNVRASCGCTGTDWPREEIKRRKKGTITVTYDTKRVGKFHKNVYVYVDGNKNPIQLEVKGEVLPSRNGNKGAVKIINTPKKVRLDGNVKATKSNAVKSSSSLKSSSSTESKEIKKEPVDKVKKEKKAKSENKVRSENKTFEKQSVITE